MAWVNQEGLKNPSFYLYLDNIHIARISPTIPATIKPDSMTTRNLTGMKPNIK